MRLAVRAVEGLFTTFAEIVDGETVVAQYWSMSEYLIREKVLMLKCLHASLTNTTIIVDPYAASVRTTVLDRVETGLHLLSQLSFLGVMIDVGAIGCVAPRIDDC